MQVHVLDYNKKFTLVAGTKSIRLVLEVAASKRSQVHHMDVKSAFLHADLKEDIYIKQLGDYIEDSPLVFKLSRSLYALKQAPRAWYSKMDAFLISHKFER